jgi:O-antigen ligase
MNNFQRQEKTTRSNIRFITLFSFAITIIISLLSFTYLTYGLGGIYLLKYLSFFLFVGFLVVYLHRELRIKIKHIILVLFIFIMLLLSLFNASQESIITSFSLLVLTVMLYALSMLVFREIPEKLFYQILETILIIICIIVIIPSFFLTIDSSNYYVIGDRVRFTGIFNNPNELARFTASGFLLALRLFPLKKLIIKLALLVIMGMSLYVINATDSRAGLMLILVGSLLFLVNWIFVKFRKRLFLIITFFSLAFCILIGYIYTLYLLSQDFFIDINQLSSGRIAIWKNVMNDLTIFELLFGSGSGRSEFTANLVLTNGYIEIITFFGLTGLTIFIVLLCYLLFSKLQNSINTMNLAGLNSVSVTIAFLIYYFFEGGIISIGNIVGIYFWLELSQRFNLDRLH